MNRESLYTVPYSKIPYKSKVVIYGAGKLGQNCYQNIKYTNRLEVVAILDRSEKEILEVWKDIPVYPPKEISKVDFDYVMIVVEKEKIALDIRQNLLEYGVEEKKIIWVGDTQDISVESSNEVHKFFLRNNASDTRRFFLFMLPEHGNTGDYAIGYAEQKFLKKYFGQYQTFGITSAEWILGKEFFLNFIKEEDVIFINGGGFFGDLRGDDVIYKDIVESFPANKKIFFPNNLTYKEKPSEQNESLLADIRWMKEQKNLHLFLRERKSYDILKNYIDNCYLTLDMVFFLNFFRKEGTKTDKILLCLRDDCEKIFVEDQKLQCILTENAIEYDKFDIYTQTYFSQEMGVNLLEYVIDKFQKYNCVITDRLHGMILSVISNVPCIALDNSTRKISGVYEWIKDNGYATLIEEDDISNIASIISSTCENKKCAGEYTPRIELFDNMAKIIAEIIDIQ